jgi:hypothetical protein
METLTKNRLEFAAALGLQPGADDLFVGKLGGFPVGLKVIDPNGAPLLLFQVRHWLPADAAQFQAVVYDPEVTRLETEKQLEIELDDRIAWVTFTGQVGPLESPTVLRVLEPLSCSSLRLLLCRNFVQTHVFEAGNWPLTPASPVGRGEGVGP